MCPFADQVASALRAGTDLAGSLWGVGPSAARMHTPQALKLPVKT